MIRVLVEASFLPRLGLAVGIYVLWGVVFLTLAGSGYAAVNPLVAFPVLVASALFGLRGAVLGTSLGVVAVGGLHVIGGTDSFGVLVRGVHPISIGVLAAISLMVGSVRALSLIHI